MAIKSGTVFINKKNLSKKRKVEKELDSLVKTVKYQLHEAKGVFPFDFFPDSVIVDLNKVTIINRFLFSKNAYPVLIEDIKTVNDFHGILFSSLTFEVSGFETNPAPVKWLWQKDAQKVRRYILAIKEARKRNIDLEALKHSEIKEKLEEIGKVLSEKEI